MDVPFVKVLSENVEVVYGFKDARALVRVRLPIPLRPWYPVSIKAAEIVRFKEPFTKAFHFGLKPDDERKKEKKPTEFQAREDCRGRYGYPDAHVELEVKRLAWIKLEFPFDEFKLANAAMDDAHAWAQLPEHVRELQGAP